MNTSQIEKKLIEMILPSGITEYFDLTDINTSGDEVILVLEERNNIPEELKNREIESQGFLPIIEIQDFPLRERAVYIRIRRRRWRDKNTGESFSRERELTAKGTKYTKEFGVFLKEMDRYTSSKHK